MKPNSNDEQIERMKSLMAEVYKDGFNIYQCLNRLKKELKLVVDFPPQAVIWTCEAYRRSNQPILNHYPWFKRVLKASSERFFSEENEKKGEKHKKEDVSKDMKTLMKGIGDG